MTARGGWGIDSPNHPPPLHCSSVNWYYTPNVKSGFLWRVNFRWFLYINTHTHSFYLCVISNVSSMVSSFDIPSQNGHYNCAKFMCIPPQPRSVTLTIIWFFPQEKKCSKEHWLSAHFPLIRWCVVFLLLPCKLVAWVGYLYQVTAQCSSKTEGLDLLLDHKGRPR